MADRVTAVHRERDFGCERPEAVDAPASEDFRPGFLVEAVGPGHCLWMTRAVAAVPQVTENFDQVEAAVPVAVACRGQESADRKKTGETLVTLTLR